MPHIEVAIRLLAACLLLVATAAQAGQDRGFSATYALGSPRSVDATHVSVPITLRLRNHSGADVTNATVSLRSLLGHVRVPKPANLQSSSAAASVAVRDRAVVPVATSFVVPTWEYERWQRGGRPMLALRIEDPSGHAVLHPIDANPSIRPGATR